MSGRKVAVTGLGILSPIGNNVPDSWAAVCAGKNGIRQITLFDASALHFRIAGEVRGFEDMDVLSAKQKKAMGRFAQLGVVAGMQAIADAGLGDSEKDAARIGISVGSGIGGLPEIEATTIKAHNDKRPNAPPRVSPFLIPSVIINIISGHLSIMYNFTGPGVSLVSACTTGAHNIGNAFRMISYGDADVMVCGGAEASITPLAIGSFGSAKALSGCNDTPEIASRPFNKKRDGFVLGEGAGVLVLEEYRRASRRGAKIYAMIEGYGMSTDAYHITAPLESGRGASQCMKNAMQDAGINANEVDYINAHGTSTLLGDIAETKAIHDALGDAAKRTAVSASKSMIGHLLGAAGGVEAAFTVLALQNGVLPPTINLDEPDPACDLDYIPNEARGSQAKVALSNSFGFGGTNASLVFRRA